MLANSLVVLLTILVLACPRWTEKQANDWYSKYSWSAGVNYIPAYADNQIQMWENLNLDEIDKEFKWAVNLGFSKFRVFLHIAPYIKNADQYLKDIFSFLAVAKSRGIHIIPVLFDDCWRDTWASGKQPEPIPGIHNSQWVQCPGNIKVDQAVLKSYVVDIIGTFKNLDTIAFWDLYNEVGNSGKLTNSLPFCKNVFAWARQANPSQPISSGFWNGDSSFNQINEFILNQSDIITFHAYCDVKCTQENIARFKKLNRPVICTEYMARLMDSNFITHLPIFKGEEVWAINWGFVFGRTQTYYPWWSKEGDPVPEVWFHDVVHPDGTPYSMEEAEAIKKATSITFKNSILQSNAQ